MHRLPIASTNPIWSGSSCAYVLLFTLGGAALVAGQEASGRNGQVSEGETSDSVAPHIRQLARYDLQPTAESLAGFLASLHPSAEQKQAIDTLIRQLGDVDYQKRETAMLHLSRNPIGAAQQLRAAGQSDNAEIRWRARQVLDRTGRESRSLLHHVYLAVERERLVGLAKPLLDSTSFCDDAYLQNALQRALLATVESRDAPLLRSTMQSPEAKKRIAALIALDSIAGNSSDREALALLNDMDDGVRAAAARLLAARGRREALPVLVQLINSSDLTIRLAAFRTLRALTGETFGFVAYEKDVVRQSASKRWADWLEQHGATATLRLPLQELPIDLGRLLVCDHGQNKLIEFDASGKEIWQRQVPMQPWACQGLANGHRLVGSYNERSIIEYDNDGTEVWKVENLPGGPTSVERLENGNTLVACTESSQVVEIDPDKKTIWKATLDGRPVDARRLDNGNTLVTLQNAQKVVEVATSGKQVWEIAGAGMAFSAQRLADGNTLVCSLNHSQIREFDPQGKVVWEKGSFQGPYSAQRLADGNTLVVDRTGVYEIDRGGEVVRQVVLKNISRAWRY